TNFEEIYKNIKRANDYTREKQTGMWDTMIKHERNKLDKELSKILKVYGGVIGIDKLPEIVIILDVKKEHNALVESIKIKDRQLMEGRKALQITGVVDTNADPTLLDCPVVANDDSVATLEYIVTLMIHAYEDGKKEYKEVVPGEEKTNIPVVVVEEIVKNKVEKPKKIVKKTKTSKK
ncbi:MAG: 30S ribosomal protein S2, partial [Patescibacteria group bacterium]